jgi:hypothetical protein
MRDQIVLRGANAGDLDIIQVIENSSFGTFDRPFTPEIFRAFLSENPLGFRVAEISGRIVGYCYTTPLRRKIFGRRYEATICSLAVENVCCACVSFDTPMTAPRRFGRVET